MKVTTIHNVRPGEDDVGYASDSNKQLYAFLERDNVTIKIRKIHHNDLKERIYIYYDDIQTIETGRSKPQNNRFADLEMI
jgi:hypothetical protein